ncbi:MAG: DUF488 domain-containing protein [Candidatus Hydrogenedentes bacterium]|nr:DUF488 domain-containing protein [Candidatus Hydrogenedentota bacterium]
MNTLYTIGHSNYEPAQFLSLLAAHGVSAIADVRSSPYSKFVPQYSKENLQHMLREADIGYGFLGRELGARRDEETCYVGDQARYDRIAELPIFRAGLDRVIEESQDRSIALMCSEADPLTCHRTILVCRALRKLHPSLPITHILPDASGETHEDALERLVALHKLEPELFGELSSHDGLIERAQDLQAERIAYTREPVET